MTAWLDPVRKAIEQATSPLHCYFRDDDAGWAEQQLFKLLDLFDQFHVPIDLAVIPTCLNQNLTKELISRIEKHGQQIGLHQHGYSHTNHQTTGRKCEFGDMRTPDQQFSDLVIGQRMLKESLGDYLQAFFTPPWNRCTQTTVDVLQSLDFEALSRDSSAAELETSKLKEIPVHIDWFSKRKGVRIDFQTLGQQIAEQIELHKTLGIMLHHQVTGDNEHIILAELLAVLAIHPSVQTCLMKEILE